MQGFEQLLAEALALELGVHAKQGQHMVRPGRQAGENGIVVGQITFGTAKTGGQQHAHAPTPALGDIQAALRGGDQRHADQAVIDQQANRRQLLVEVLLHQFPYGGAHALVITRAFGFEEIGKGRLMAIGVVQQRACFAGITAIEHTDFGRTVRHRVRPLVCS
ncbi:hypothetical protein D3C86_1649790 [compost metagenome]